MTLSDLLKRFLLVADNLQSEGRAFGKLAGIKDGDNPSSAPPERLGCAYSAASYQVASKSIRDEVKKIEKEIQ